MTEVDPPVRRDILQIPWFALRRPVQKNLLRCEYKNHVLETALSR